MNPGESPVTVTINSYLDQIGGWPYEASHC